MHQSILVLFASCKKMEIFFIVTIVLLFCSAQLIDATTILFPGESLSSDQTFVSRNGDFAFKFSSEDCYMSILLMHGDSYHNFVWSADIEYIPSTMIQPCTLSLSQSGNLTLTQSKNVKWSTNLTKSEQDGTILVLLDTGNLVLCDRTNSGLVLWQTFDHPQNIWLPGAWLGYGNISGQNMALSLFSECCTLEIDRSSGRWGFMVMNQLEDNIRYFGTFPSLLPIKYDSGLITINSTESPPLYVALDDFSGGINIWKGAKLLYGYRECLLNCGPFGLCTSNFTSDNVCKCPLGFRPTSSEEFSVQNYSAGCQRIVSWNCTRHSALDSNKYRFHLFHNITTWPAAFSEYLKDLNKEECENFCLNNCSCTAYSFYDDICLNWYGELWNMSISDDMLTGTSIYIRFAIVGFAIVDNNKKEKLIIGGILIIVVVCLLFLSIIIGKFLCVKSVKINDHLGIYTYREMRSATKNFSIKLGEGGFGSVFKGRLFDRTEVAVKKLKVVDPDEKQFRSEVQTLGIIRHINLVGLLGFCAEGKRRFLVYEYMPKGSLDSHLFTKSITLLSWKCRYRIAVGIAKGLAYLHEQCTDCIIHCDIKPENVLLDELFSPKIADFGMSKLLDRDFSRVLTTMRGTIGYLAPEWISGEAITHKADVYSFGMMLFEIISGKRNASKFNNRRYPFFPLYATMKMNEGEALCLLDERLGGNVNVIELIQICKVAGWCIQDAEASRPSMGKVVLIIQGVIDVGIPPVPKSLLNLLDAEDY